MHMLHILDVGHCCGLIQVNFTHILQGYFTGIGAILPNCQSASEVTLKNGSEVTYHAISGLYMIISTDFINKILMR